MARGMGTRARGLVRFASDVNDAAIVVAGITKRFGATTALGDVSLRVEPGTFVSLLGPSGCGKTTLLRIIGGFERQDAGSVTIHGRRVDRLPPNRRPVNTVFQRYALFPHKSIFANIAFPLALRSVPLQKQREAVRRIQEELGTSFLYVTHDQEEALTMSDRIVLMNDGRIVQEGSPTEIYDRPATVFASGFIGEANLLRGSVAAVDGERARVCVLDSSLEVIAPAQGIGPDHPVV